MLTLTAKWISEELLDILSEQEYRIHSNFESGFNVQVEDVLCYIGNKYDMKIPYAILLKRKDVGLLNEIEDLEIDLSKAHIYSSKMKTCVKDPQERVGACEFILRCLAQEEISPTIQDLQSRISMDHLLGMLKCGEDKAIQSVLSKVVGYGMGLTPSGDDFLTGIIYVYQLFGMPISTAFLDSLNSMLSHGYTTDISAHYYRCALQSLYSQPLLDLARSLEVMIQDKDHGVNTKANILAKNALEQLFTFGHTSGRDTAAGIKCACEILRKGMRLI